MHRAIKTAIATALLFLSVTAMATQRDSAAGYQLPLSGQATVSLVEGTVHRQNGETLLALEQGDSIKAPAAVAVEQGARLELLLPDGSVLRFAGGTRFELVDAVANVQNRRVEVDVSLGDCWATVSDFLGEGEDEFEVNAPTAVAGVAGTVYRLNVDRTRNALYRVYEGRVRVGSRWLPQGKQGPRQRVEGPERVEGPSRVTEREWLEIVSAGHQFRVGAGGAHETPRPFDLREDRQDPWVRWNLERDRTLRP
jgi:hypothetical protein